MTVRASLLALALLFAVTMTAAPQLVSGPDVDVGLMTPGVPLPSYKRAAMATDGDAVLAVHMSHNFYTAALFATRIDRSGRVLTPQPIPLLTRTATDGVDPNVELQMLWFRGTYVVFFMNRRGDVEALRLGRDGAVVERAVVLPATPGSRMPFAVATDGAEIVLVNAGTKLHRIGADLRPLGTLDLPPPRYAWYPVSRGVAYGGGRFVIVTVFSDRVISQFLENGTLNGVEMPVADANIDRAGVTRVVWTGTAFVAAWTECSEANNFTTCLGVWTPLASHGQAAGPLRVVSFSDLTSSTWYKFDLTLTVLDEQTIFFTWRAADEQVAFGRRYRLSGAAVGEAVNFGTGPLGALRTDGGALAVLDSRGRLAWIEAAATAPVTAEAPLVPAVSVPRSETLLGATASANEVGVVRAFSTGTLSGGAELSVLSFDGTPLRSIPIAGRQVHRAAIASDGRDFYVLTSQWGAALHLYLTASATTVKLSDRASSPHLVWTGAELLAVWKEGDRFQLVRLDREGRRLAEPLPLDAAEVLRLFARGDRVFLSTYGARGVAVTLLDVHGTPIGPADELRNLNPWWGLALATGGDTDAVAAVDANRRLFLAFRPRHGTFVAAPATPMPPPPAYSYSYMVSLAWTRAGFVVTYGMATDVLPALHLALVDAQGFAVRSLDFPTGAANPILLETGPDTLLLLYDRMTDDATYAGQTRVFARRIAVRNERRERDEPLPLPR